MKQRKSIRYKQYPVIIGIIGILISSLSFANGNTRIVGGNDTNTGKWPFAVILMADGALVCGGSLVAPNWVLTAAHCIAENPDEVILGRTDLTTNEGERIGIIKTIVHPEYDSLIVDNDIALIELNTSSVKKPISLVTPADMKNIESSSGLLTVIGWGLLFEDNPVISDILQEVNVKFIARTICNGADWYNGEVTSNQFCAGLEQGGKDSCSGDSGGPIFIGSNSGSALQAGIVSWGSGCAREKSPGVYTRIANYNGWIEDNIQESSALDSDKDGVPDDTDNCTEVANPEQIDDDNDNFGNRCDGDLNNDEKTSFSDIRLFVGVYLTEQGDADYRADADFNTDEIIDIEDFRILVKFFGMPPGPSGLVK